VCVCVRVCVRVHMLARVCFTTSSYVGCAEITISLSCSSLGGEAVIKSSGWQR